LAENSNLKEVASLLKSNDNRIKVFAVNKLASAGAKEFISDIAELLSGDNKLQGFDRNNVIIALGKLGAIEYKDNIAKCLHDISNFCDAVAVLAEFGAKNEVISALRMVVSYKYSFETIHFQSVVKAVVSINASEAFDDLVLLLKKHGNQDLKKEIINALFFLNKKESNELFLDMLSAHDSASKATALFALGELGLTEYKGEIADVLVHEKDLWLRIEAAVALAKFQEPKYSDEIAGLLEQDSEKRSSDRIVWALGKLKAKDHADKIVELLKIGRTSLNSNLVGACIDALRELGASQYKKEIARSLSTSTSAAMIALASLGCREYIQNIVEMFELSPYDAMRALVMFNSLSVQSDLETLLLHDNWGVRCYAAYTLFKLGCKDSVGKIKRLAKWIELNPCPSEKLTVYDFETNTTKDFIVADLLNQIVQDLENNKPKK
ncbi:MAG: hypothetical protein HY606_13685, partial [Planctomycetes bacterium]|nr:hypothetical protein [Planctomycetota bacterium]